MAGNRETFRPVKLSLADLAGREFIEAVCEARGRLAGEDPRALLKAAAQAVDFYPRRLQERLLGLLTQVGDRVRAGAMLKPSAGATSHQFQAADKPERAPLNGYGFYRVGADGRLYLITRSEHFHAPLGHAFPGYGLIDRARRLGIPNATHNDTRGEITRRLETELVCAANGIGRGDWMGLARAMEGDDPDAINRVLNLETGSLAVEAALKMILARFYRTQEGTPDPLYRGRIPVLLVMGTERGGLTANYHGTTVLAQAMRGMWPGLLAAMVEKGMLRICTVRPDSLRDVEDAFANFDRSGYKIAGFFHEIVMMNYGARTLSPDFLRRAHALCRERDVPTVVDEIQTCLWSPGFFMAREYGLRPTFLTVGKGFPGGEYSASRVLFNAALDNLPQFGALVTHGQEELASLSYLITMRWAEANAEATRAVGDYYEERLRELAGGHRGVVAAIWGRRHLASIVFHEAQAAEAFAGSLARRGLDLAATRKPDCPPVVMTKLPLTVPRAVVDFILARMAEALGQSVAR